MRLAMCVQVRTTQRKLCGKSEKKTFVFFFNFEKRPANEKIPARCVPCSCASIKTTETYTVGRLGEKRIIRVEGDVKLELSALRFYKNMTARRRQRQQQRKE